MFLIIIAPYLSSQLSQRFSKKLCSIKYMTTFVLINFFYENQYGFRKCHSTELAALELVDRLFKHLNDGKIPVSVFLDLSKAFDTLNNAILMDKLKYYGLNETSLNLFRSYLHDRYQCTEYNGTCSDVINLTTGVPQGSILGPLLLIIYMNDIHVATSNFKAFLYADDTNNDNGKNCIRYLLPRIINKTNHTIVTMVDTYSYQGFVHFVKNDMIGHYIENCSISNCYICNHTHSEWPPLTYSEWESFNKKIKINKKQ